MLGVVLCVFVWRMHELFISKHQPDSALGLTALSRLPHIRQELKCLRDNSSQLSNPRSQTTGMPLENLFHQPTWKFRESNSRFEECYILPGCLRTVRFSAIIGKWKECYIFFTTCHLNHHSSIARLVDLQNLVWVQDEHRAHACFELHLMSKKNMYIHLPCVINFMSFKDGLSYTSICCSFGVL